MLFDSTLNINFKGSLGRCLSYASDAVLSCLDQESKKFQKNLLIWRLNALTDLGSSLTRNVEHKTYLFKVKIANPS